jgi:prolyl-tRNA synthetase
VPIRLEVGPRDIAEDSVFMARRDKGHKDKQSFKRAEFVAQLPQILDEIQGNLFERAKAFRAEHTQKIDSKDEFYSYFTPQNRDKPEIHGGFAQCHWNGSEEVEEQVKNDLNVTIRCIPLAGDGEAGTCIFTGEPSKQRVIFGKAY